MGSFGWLVDDLNDIEPTELFSWANISTIDTDIETLPQQLFDALQHLTSETKTNSVKTCLRQARKEIVGRFFKK